MTAITLPTEQSDWHIQSNQRACSTRCASEITRAKSMCFSTVQKGDFAFQSKKTLKKATDAMEEELAEARLVSISEPIISRLSCPWKGNICHVHCISPLYGIQCEQQNHSLGPPAVCPRVCSHVSSQLLFNENVFETIRFSVSVLFWCG